MSQEKNSSGLNHAFDVQFAIEFGVDISILIHHFQFWISYNARLGKNYIEGKTWMYQTQKQLSACLPYYSEKQIERLIVKMIDHDILVKGNYNKSAYDRTAWYAFKDEKMFSIPRNRGMDSKEQGNGIPETGEPIPNKKTDDKTDVVCCAEAPKKISVCEIRSPSGEKTKIRIDDLYTLAVQENKDWTAAEIEGAWKALSDSNKSIRTWERFIEGVIDNARLKQKSQEICNTNTRKQCTQKIKTEYQQKISKNSSEKQKSESTESDIKMQPLVQLLSPKERAAWC